MMEISLRDLKKLRISHTEEAKQRVNCLEFHESGEVLIYNTDDVLRICTIGDQVRNVKFEKKHEKYGQIKFFKHHVLHSSENLLKLLDVENNNYINYWAGHAKPIISLATTSRSDLFASSSDDTSVRLWTARERKQLKMRAFPDPPLIAFHPGGSHLAVAYNSDTIELLEARDLVTTCKFYSEKVDDVKWTGIKFSNKGKMLMVTTNSSFILIFDVHREQELFKLTGFTNVNNAAIDACFTPDDKFVLGGSFDGMTHIWDLSDSGFKAFSLKKPHVGPCYHVAFNPRYMNLATTSDRTNVHLWTEKI